MKSRPSFANAQTAKATKRAATTIERSALLALARMFPPDLFVAEMPMRAQSGLVHCCTARPLRSHLAGWLNVDRTIAVRGLVNALAVTSIRMIPDHAHVRMLLVSRRNLSSFCD